MKYILEIKNIHKSFADKFTGKKGKEVITWSQVLKGISLKLNPGTVTAIIGGNGSGKSTLFNIISGLLPVSEGRILYRYNGKSYDLANLPSHLHAGLGISRLFQGSNIFPTLTVMENMLVADNMHLGEHPWDILLRPRSVIKQDELRKEEAQGILKLLLGKNNTLWEKRKEAAGTLSTGQQRLLAFARLLMNENAELYLLDEPCAGVNSLVRETMATMIHNLRDQGKTILLIEHNMEFAKKVASNAHYLEEGKIVLSGPIHVVIDSDLVRENYLGLNHQSDA